MGGNGSGKSTLLQVVYGTLSLSRGERKVEWQGRQLEHLEIARHSSFSAPYFELVEELEALELVELFARFRPLAEPWTPQRLLEMAYLQKARKKEVRHFSSGMKQRLKLALALCAQSEMILLDEPTSNLDPKGVAWYQEQSERLVGDRILLVGSNYNREETFLCRSELSLADYKN